MKVCTNCDRLNPDTVETCIGCDGEEFNDLHFIMESNDIEPYLEGKDDNRNRNQVP